LFLSKITKKWAILVYLVYFFNLFQGTSKSGKISKPIFPYNLVRLMLFPGFDKLSTTKNTNATFFSSRRKYYLSIGKLEFGMVDSTSIRVKANDFFEVIFSRQ